MMTVQHGVGSLGGKGCGGLAELGLLGEDPDPVAEKVLDQPGVQDIEPVGRGAVLLGCPGEAAGLVLLRSFKLDDMGVQGRESEGAEPKREVGGQHGAASMREGDVSDVVVVGLPGRGVSEVVPNRCGGDGRDDHFVGDEVVTGPGKILLWPVDGVLSGHVVPFIRCVVERTLSKVGEANIGIPIDRAMQGIEVSIPCAVRIAFVDTQVLEPDDPRPRDPGRLPSHADLNLLRTFLAVYRAGSFTAAAPVLGLSQPTVTTQIRALEQQIARDLFLRQPRGVEPTSYAHELARQVEGPLDALVALEDSSGVASPVHLAGPSELLCVRVLPALVPLVAEGVELRVGQGLPELLMDELRAGRHDLVISTRRPRGRADQSIPLADEEYVLVASPGWATQPADGDSADDVCTMLRDVPLVAYAEDLPIVRRYWRNVFGKQLTASAAVTVPNLYAVLSAINAGAGYSVLPQSLCQEHLDAGRLVRLHDPQEPPLNTLFLVQRPGAEANPAVIRVRERLCRVARTW